MLRRLLLLAGGTAARVVRVAVVCWCSLLLTLIALPRLLLLDGVAGGVKTPPPNLFYPISFIFIGKLEFQLHVVVTSARLKRPGFD